MESKLVKCGKLSISNSSPFTLIAGPCQLENESHAVGIANKLKEITQKLDIGFVYKTSFDKANRTSLKGKRGSEGKIAAIKYARLNNIPFFGICFGMQMAVIEAARNLLNIKNASTSEFGNNCTPVVGLLEEWQKGKKMFKGSEKNLGGTMRLGLYDAILKNNSLISKIYSLKKIRERHRHRYEVNIKYKDKFEKKGLIFSALSPDGMLPEIIELKNHPWFVGVQFHPEFKSRPFTPHPLFSSFVKAAEINKERN